MFFIPFDHLENCLKKFLHYGMKSENILRDLHAFQSSIATIDCRLKKARDAGVEKIMPWMLRIVDFDTFIKRSVDENAALGKHKDMSAFLIEYLDLEPDRAAEIFKTYPRILKRRGRNVRTTNVILNSKNV